ncbi:MAG TPA: NAD(P)-dependent oxidoreductase, partial [Candidatus Acidoferrum sp.]|nr:NAD(P)-dependent oxidoreductase [Candidatus Acidoferrum sp.]
MIPAEMHDHAAILITGANGFIGRAVVRLLQNSNQKLVLLDHHSASAPAVSTFATTFACDIADPLHLRRIFEAERIASIIHLAAILPTAASKDPSRATRVNVLGSLNLLEMAREFRIPRFVFGSSLSVYGTCRIDQVVNENFRAAPEDVYGAAKLYVEQIGRAYANLNGLEFVSLRIGRVIGAGAQSTTSAWRSQIFELLRNHRPATIHIPCPATERLLLAHVNDVARALLQLLRAPRPEHDVYN